MSEEQQQEDFVLKAAAFLDSVRSSYPDGLPLKPAVKPVEHGAEPFFFWGSPEAEMVFVLFDEDWGFDEDGAPFAGATGDLLRSVITKGLGFEIRRVAVAGGFSAAMDVGIHTEFFAMLRKHPVELLFCAGESALRSVCGVEASLEILRGKWIRINEKAIFPSYSLSQIASDLSLKRAFWQDLKTFAQRL